MYCGRMVAGVQREGDIMNLYDNHEANITSLYDLLHKKYFLWSRVMKV